MYVCKDIYLYITVFTDDKTTLNMLSVNKKYYDEKILLIVMNTKYPLLYKIVDKKKYKNLKLREFYVKMLQYISKLFLDRGIPYISHREFDPYELYKMSKKKYSYPNFLRQILYYSLENGNFDIASKMLEKDVKIDTLCILYAVKSKNIDVVNFLIKVNGTEDKYINNKIIEFAASEGDITFINEILKLNIYEKEKINDLYKLAMFSAGEKGHIHIVKKMLVNGANNYNETMMNAAKGGFIDIVKLMLENGADNYNETMEKARGKNRFEIVKIMLERTKDKNTRIINKNLSDAGKNGNYEIVKLMIENGATYFNECLFYSIRNNNYNIFEIVIDKCDINKYVSYYSKRGYEKFVDKYIYHAAKVGNIKMVQKLLEKEGKECPKILKYAVKSGKLFDFLTRQNIGILDCVEIVKSAAKSGNIILFNSLYNKYENFITNELNDILLYACKGGNINIVKFLVEKGANNFTLSLVYATERGYLEIVKFLSSK